MAGNKKFDITLIDPREQSSMKPAMPEVAFQGKAVEKTRFALRPVIEGRGATFLNNSVVKIKPKKQVVILDDKSEIEYDYLVVTAGAKKDF
jgi:sulfide:quinone oxidoreductase